MPKNIEDICLKRDNGSEFTFRGRLFSECSWFDEENGAFTRQKLYITENNEQVYYIIRTVGHERTSSIYQMSVQGDSCTISNGKTEVKLQFNMLMQAVRGLCGLNAEATPSLENVEEIMRKAAND